ncbi:lysin B [Mycobacterium phage Loadrie]|nr:lysin B [Mycobacterium phage Loadrie]
MPLQVGSQGELVNQWVRTMNKRFSSYSREKDGTPLKVDGYFGYPDRDVQREYERRTNQVQDGIVSDGDLAALGLIATPPAEELPVLFTVSGTFADMWSGYPADCARALTGVYYWQPVYYRAAAFPMEPSVNEGVAELISLINKLAPGRKFALCGYSQGAIVCSLVLIEILFGSLSHRKGDLLGGSMFGNPMRQAGVSFPGGRDPGGRGIALEQLKVTPPNWFEYADPDDIYAATPTGAGGEEMSSIYAVVMDPLKGAPKLVWQIWELLANPAAEAPALVKAIVLGLKFAGTRTAAHVEYHIRQATPGTTYLQHAINHLRSIRG